jgi:hypothetical protein
MILATAETAITIVAASLPVLRVFIRNTMQSKSSQENSKNTQFSYNISNLELLTEPSPVRIDSSKKDDFDFQINERSRVPKRKKATSKSTEDSWLSSASQSRLELAQNGS